MALSVTLGVLGVPGTSVAAAGPSLARPMTSPAGAPVVGVSSAPSAAGTSAVEKASPPATVEKKKKKKRRFGKLRIGISTGASIAYAAPARMDKDLVMASRFGADQLRLDINWAVIQPEKDVVDWSRTDALFDASKGKGLNILAMVGYAPEWAENPDGSVKPELFADFVAAAAERYANKVAAWEIWNEPNQTRAWIAPPDPAAYARVVEAASPPIRKHDPRAKILMGALAPAVDDPDGDEISPITFLKGVYAAGIDRSAYDVVSIHPFSYPALPSGDEEWNTFNRLPDIYRVVRNNGDGKKPFWLTEYGARTGTTSNSVSFARQTALMKDAYRETKKLPFVQALFFYSLRDASTNRKEPEDNFGLLRFDGSPKPVYTAMRRVLKRG